MTTAELVCMSAADARAITDRIKVGVEAIWELIKQAYNERAWDALGYSSWDDYCTREFGSSRIRLPREERQEVVSSLRESGLSIRAIAAATGMGRGTVEREVAPVPNGTPELEPVDVDAADDTADCIHCGLNLPLANLYEGGQGYECDPCVAPDEEPEEEPTPRITGTDGKSYPAKPSTPKEPSAPRRKALTDSARDIGLDLGKLLDRIERFAADDRLGRNKNEVAPHLRHYLVRAIQVCQDLDNQLSQGE